MRTPHTARERLRPARGFILVSVLWLLAGLTVVAGLVSRYGVTAAERAQLVRLRSSAEIAMASTRSDVLLLLAATRATTFGLSGASGPLYVDNRVYTGRGSTLVRIQDARGLIDLNRSSDEVLERLFTVCGAPVDQAASLVARLRDYTDADDLIRLNGAERDAYAAAGKPAPRNAPLQEAYELWQVLGMAAIRPEWVLRGCNDAVTVEADGLINIRTAPYRALLAAGYEESIARALSSPTREEEAYRTAQSLQSFDRSANPFAGTFSTFAGRTFRVQHFDPQAGLQLEYWVVLNTGLPDKPWLLKGESVVSLPQALRLLWVPAAPADATASSPLAPAVPSSSPLPQFNSRPPKETDSAPQISLPFL